MKKNVNRKPYRAISDGTHLKKHGNRLLIFSLVLKLYELIHEMTLTTGFKKIVNFIQTLIEGF